MDEIKTPVGEADKLPDGTHDKKALVRLDGACLTIGGKEARAHYFDDLKEMVDDYRGVTLTQAEALGLSRQMRKLRTGFQATMPIRCPGAKVCPIVSICPLAKMDIDNLDKENNPKVPVGKFCPIEAQLFVMWLEDYCEELEVTPDDILDMALCRQLAELDIYELRLTVHLGHFEHAMGVGENVVGYDQEKNEAITMEQIAPAMDLKLRLKDKRMRILQSLVATRQEKYKEQAALKEAPTADPSTLLANLKKKLESGMAGKVIETLKTDGGYIPIA